MRYLRFTALVIMMMILATGLSHRAYGENDFVPRIAEWYQNRQAAVTMRFDDSQPSHVETVIPLLNRYGFHATFMVNPGLARYQRNKEFWENEVPKMGHRLGNHTLHHEGARNPEEADHEIGEVARLIWRLYPDRSKLMVFASGGGGKKWGGKLWQHADPVYTKDLVAKYHLIDLYDGTHPSYGASRRTAAELCAQVDQAIEKGDHYPITFHNVGRSTFKDLLRPLMGGHNLTVSKDQFIKILDCFTSRKDKLWVAPLVEVIKYKDEYRSASLKPVNRDARSAEYALSVRTDATLYDHDMTLVLQPGPATMKPKAAYQDQTPLDLYQDDSGAILADVKPITSTIRLLY